MKKQLLVGLLVVLSAGVAFGGETNRPDPSAARSTATSGAEVTNTRGVRVIDILDQTQTGLNGDEPSIGYISYNQVGGNLLIDIHVVKAPEGSSLPCDLTVELVVPLPNGQLTADATFPDDWATGGIGEDVGGESGHFGFPNTLMGTITIDGGAIAGVGSFVQSTDEGAILDAQAAGLRNYGHIDLEGCGLEDNQVGASRVEWITTKPK